VTGEDIHAIQDRLDSQERRLGERLDRQDEKLDRIVEAVTRQVAICGPARVRLDAVCETVYGDGQNGLIRKIERLETVREIGSKGFWALVSLVSAIVSGVILAVGGTLLGWLKG
jgi:hypothetical protein